MADLVITEEMIAEVQSEFIARPITRETAEALIYFRNTPNAVVQMPYAEWDAYIKALRKMSDKAAQDFIAAVNDIRGPWHGVGLSKIPRDELIDYAYGLATKYGEGSSAIAAEFYDLTAEFSGADIPPAIPAETATISETAKVVNGTIKSENVEIVGDAIGRLVKQAAADTTTQNAARDKAEWAWIPHGVTCAYCIAKAAAGWERASFKALRDGQHAEHIHPNCDCQYAVRINGSPRYEGYEPRKYKKMYYNGEPTAKGRLNKMRREFYAEQAEKIRSMDLDEDLLHIANANNQGLFDVDKLDK